MPRENHRGDRDFNHTHTGPDLRRWQTTELRYNKQFHLRRHFPTGTFVLAVFAVMLVLGVVWVYFF